MNGSDINHDSTPTKKPLTAKQEKAFKQFKELTKDITDLDDHDLEKWLRARRFDANKANQMLRNSIQYKKKMKVHTLVKEYTPPEVLVKYQTGGFCGHAIDGSTVVVELFGNLDIKGLMFSAKKSDLEKIKLLQCEWIMKDWADQSEKLGRRVDGLTLIFDMANVGTDMLWRPGVQMYLHLVKILEDNYPEMLKRMIIINAPGIFPVLYKISKPFVSEEMKQKIHVCSDNYQDVLLRYITKENIPACYGGTLTDPDGNPKCVTMIGQGGVVPKEYYIKKSENFSQMETALVPSGEKLYLKYKVDAPGTVISWEFHSEDHDIGFGFLYEENEKYTSIIPVSRVDSHVIVEDGTHKCEKKGKYVLCFDNSFSWTRSKKVYYTCDVIEPDNTLIINQVDETFD